MTWAMFLVSSMMLLPVPPSPENRPACLSGTRLRIAHSRSGMGSLSQPDISIQRSGGSDIGVAVVVVAAAVGGGGDIRGGHSGASEATPGGVSAVGRSAA